MKKIFFQFLKLIKFKKNATNLEITDWFKKCKNHYFGIEMPDGWLGRPFDNLHKIDLYEINENIIWFRFDEGREITIKKATEIRVVVKNNIHTLSITNFEETILLWFDYGKDITSSEIITFNSGRVQLHGYNF